MNIFTKIFGHSQIHNESSEEKSEIGEGIISRLTNSVSIFPSDYFAFQNEEESDYVISHEPEKESGFVARAIQNTLDVVDSGARKAEAFAANAFGYGLDAAIVGAQGAYCIGNWTAETIHKIKGNKEQTLVSAGEGLNSQLIRLEKECDAEGAAFLAGFGDFFTKFALDFAPKKGVISTVLNYVGLENIENTIKSNMLNALLNVLKKSTLKTEIDNSADNEYAGLSDLFLPQYEGNPLMHFKSALQNIFAPFLTEYNVKESLIQDAAREVENKQAKVAAFDTVTLPLRKFLERNSADILRRQKIMERFAQAGPTELQNAVEVRQFLKSEASKDLVIFHEQIVFILNRAEKFNDIRDAENTLIQCDCELEVINALIHQDTAKLNIFKNEAEQITNQLKILDFLAANDVEGLATAKQAAVLDLEKAQQNLNKAVESRKSFIYNHVAPEFLKALFPEGADSLLIYQKYLAVFPAQEQIFSLIEDKFPIYFEQFLPFLLEAGLPQQEALLNTHPHAATIETGINCFANDLWTIAANCLDIPDSLRSNLQEFIAPYLRLVGINYANKIKDIDRASFMHIISLISEIKLLSPTKEELKNPGNALVKAFESLYPEKDIEEYLKALNLPMENTSKLKRTLRKALKDLYKETNIITAQKAIAEVMKLLQLDDLESLGLPALIAKPVDKLIVKHVGRLFNEYLLNKKMDLSHIECTHLPTDTLGGTAFKVNTLQQALTSIIHVQLNKQLDMRVKAANGFHKHVNCLVKLLAPQVDKLGDSSNLLGFLGELLNNGALNGLMENIFNLTNSNQNLVGTADAEVAKGAKIGAVQLLMPLLMNMTIKSLEPLLQKEKEGGAVFDQTLLVRLLPFVTEHLENLNEPSSDPLTSNILNSETRKDMNYKNLSAQLLNFFLPKKTESLRELFPHFSKKEINLTWDLLVSELPGLLFQLVEVVFEKSMINDILIEIYELCIETFETPSSSSSSNSSIPTAAEITLQAEIDTELKKLMYQAAKVTDLPVDKFLKIASYLPGNQKILDIIVRATTQAIQKKFNGELIVDNLDKALKGQINKPEQDPTVTGIGQEAKLQQLERKLIDSACTYALRSVKEKVNESLKIFDYPIIKQIKDIILTVANFVIFRLIGGLFNMIGLNTKLTNKLYEILHRNRVNISNKYAQPKRHENLVFDLAQAGVNVLERDWQAPHPILVN